VAHAGELFAGYLTLRWESRYRPFREAAIPEIQDLNVLPDFRRRGVATRLIREAEAIALTRSDTVGIGVGLHREYGPAQRLYVKLGFLPDGNGAAYDAAAVDPMAVVVLDDRLTIYLTKSLRAPRPG
jgi:GNAT superfamily N-acetyltransferase